MPQFEPPPTYADVITIDDKTGNGAFNPLWLRWFLDLAAFVKSPSGGTVSLLDDSSSVLSNRAYREFVVSTPQLGDSVDALSAVLINRSFVPPVPSSNMMTNDVQTILPTQIFGS